ncbi:MAG: dialkylresorcinol condensing enzyme DarA [Brumimicrobium sp.]
MKKVLVIYYSQTGQLKDIANNLISPLNESKLCEVSFYNIKPVEDFPFPWNRKTFFGVFPESFQQIPVAIEPPPDDVLNTKYDLIIFAYQVWFLSPSIPINSFLKSQYGGKLLNNTPVITVVGCRNMWVMAQEKVKALINKCGGKLVSNVSFVDRNINHISVITIVHWMFKGKKTRMLGIFPKPGVSKEDISSASKFGELVLDALKKDSYKELQKKIVDKGGVLTKPFLILMDQKANKMFALWSKFVLRNNKSRSVKLFLFNIYLWIAIWLISPIVFVIFLVTYPFRMKKIKNEFNYYLGL